MILAIGLDNGMTGRSVAWALDYPGCFAYGKDGGQAIVSMPQAFLKYKGWIDRHTSKTWLPETPNIDVRLVQTWQTYFINERFEVTPEEGLEINAWFNHDWNPLNEQEICHGQEMLSWSRSDLLTAVYELSPAQLDATHPGQRWTIHGILAHVATTEWWYLDRLGLTANLPQSELPKDPHQRLDVVRARLEQVFPSLAGSTQKLSMEGEFWSPRKLLRRLLWHELDHIGHIYQLMLMA
jgi:uncharacterized damage-inducible protein DinB